MFLWVSSCLSSFFCFFLLCFRSSFDISRVPIICSTSFWPLVFPVSLYISLYSVCLFIFAFSLCVFVLAFLFEVVGSLFGHFLVSWLHLFCAFFGLCVVCKTCSQFICFGSQQNPSFRTTSLICIPTSTGIMTRASEAFIRVVNLTGIIAEVGDLAY